VGRTGVALTNTKRNDLSMNFLKEVLNGENFSLSDYSLK
jgi:hypothetical protein